MPSRLIPFVNNQFYHVFNRGINKQPIFLEKRDYSRAIETLEFYSFSNHNFKFSHLFLLSVEERKKFWNQLRKTPKIVKIISYCLMPNHFHLLLRQEIEGGISKFLRLFENSYTRFFNTKHSRFGPILQGQFKAVLIENQNQLLHVSRYQHLNPYSSYLVKNLAELENYPWSSLPEYLGKSKSNICQKEFILESFRNPEDYGNFVFDQAEYQQTLQNIKYLLLEEI